MGRMYVVPLPWEWEWHIAMRRRREIWQLPCQRHLLESINQLTGLVNETESWNGIQYKVAKTCQNVLLQVTNLKTHITKVCRNTNIRKFPHKCEVEFKLRVNVWKIVHLNHSAEKDMKIWLIIAAIHTTSGLNGMQTHDLCYTVQCTTNWAIQPTGGWSWLHIP